MYFVFVVLLTTAYKLSWFLGSYVYLCIGHHKRMETDESGRFIRPFGRVVVVF